MKTKPVGPIPEGFPALGGELAIGGKPVSALVEHAGGTPLFVYSRAHLDRRIEDLRAALPNRIGINFAVKANPNMALLGLMHKEALVDGLDVASSGELAVAMAAGWSPSALSYTGPAKGEAALGEACSVGVGTLCFESLAEAEQWLELGQAGLDEADGTTWMWRINLAEPLHAFGMQISGRPSPFGVDEEALDGLFRWCQTHQPQRQSWGLHVHAGSQCFSARAMARSMARTLKIARRFEDAGLVVSHVNFGGGFGVGGWRPPKILDPTAVAGHLRGLLRSYPRQLQIRLEPGRAITGPAGIFVARVRRRKVSRGQLFLNLDGGMHHYLTATGPELATPQRPIWVVNLSRPDAPVATHQLCGPLCTTRDQIGTDAAFPEAQVGDLLGWPNAGAYGLTASPCFFLGHQTPAELLHDEGRFSLIRAPVSLADLGQIPHPSS